MKRLSYFSPFAAAKIFAVTTLIVSNSDPSGAGSLAQAISDINVGGDTEFNVEFTTNPITLTGSLPLLNLSVATPLTATVNFNPDGGSHISGLTIDGSGTQSLFYLAGGTITMKDMIVTGGYAKGGNGSAGGGGALGAGGAIFVATGASFQGTNVQFTSNQAVGGNGGNGNTGTRSGGGGGGMLQGNGGGTMNSLSGGGGGGIQSVGMDSSAATGAPGGGPAGGAGGTAIPAGPGDPGGYASGGGGAGSFVFNLADGNGANGGAGGYGGGGGGGSVGALGGNGGAGGFGGGGGSAGGGGSLFDPPPANSGGNGGAGGFGGGGGGGGAGLGVSNGLGGNAGNATYGGGAGGHGSTSPTQSNGGGGGGSALGGAVFVDTGASFSLLNSTAFTGNSLTFGTGGAAGGDDATGGANGVAFGSDLFLNSSTTANFTTTSASSLAGSISGFGSILKTGTATLTIADISDSNISRITVEQGILSTPGSVTAGSMSFQLTSDHNNFGQLVVGGTANISTTDLLLNFSPGSYSGEYEILTAGTLNGTFASVTPSPLGFSYTLVYRGNDVFVVFGTSALGINTEGLNGNALAIANYLNTLDSSTYASIVQSLNSLSLKQRKEALDAMSPSTNSFGPFAAQNMLFLFQETLNLRQGNQRIWNRLGRNQHSEEFVAENEEILTTSEEEYAVREEKPFAPIGKMRGDAKYSFWASGIGQFATQTALHQNPGFHVSSGGGLIGFDYGNPERGLVGCAAGFANSYVKEKEHLGHISVDQYLAVLYGNVYWNPFYLELALWNGIDTFENKRNIRFTGFDESAKSSHLDYQLSPHLGFGADWFVGPLGIEPFCNVDWPINFENDFSESGAGLLDMKQKSQNDSMLRVEPGLRLYERVFSTNWVFLFREKLSYVYKKPFNGGDRITANIVGAPGSFVVTWMTSAQNLFSTSFELFGKSNSNRYFSVLYDGEFGSGYISNQVTARFGMYF